MKQRSRWELRKLLGAEFGQSISSRVRNGFNISVPPADAVQIEKFISDASRNLCAYNTAVEEMEEHLASLKNARDVLGRRCDSARGSNTRTTTRRAEQDLQDLLRHGWPS
ncbi:hypothetical protein BT96DRAFT_984784 [Gymnopus androsaceus JB14]|uniref:Uncharacterized protein n=1 Tax=Gymnopus androsaceus JB14 TaxID=1447944 RepID=A0A6A4IMT0_9AGAR|nr:hypothetical protein BT96DRAFT_984784 [Gymnopus androsaceus JB14]